MTDLVTDVTNLATRVGTEAKALRTLINGNLTDLSTLTTTTKASLLAAINELQADITTLSGSAAGISDGTTTTSTTWSSTKINTAIGAATAALVASSPVALDTLKELADALGDDANYAATTTTALGNRVRFDAVQTLTTGQKTQALSNIGGVGTADVGDIASANFVTTFTSALV